MAEWFDGFDLTVTIWESGPLDPPANPYDVTAYVAGRPGITIRRGRSGELDTFSPGTCTLTLRNRDLATDLPARIFDTTNPSSPMAPILKARRRLQVTADGHTLFVGYVEGWPQWWTGQHAGAVEIVAHDFLSVMAGITVTDTFFTLDVDQLDVGRLGGDLPIQRSGERVASLLGLAGLEGVHYIATDRGATELDAGPPEGDLLEAAQLAEEAEGGFLFVDRNGVITFLSRHSRFLVPRLADVQASFLGLEYASIEVSHDLAQVRNDVRRNRPDGEPQVATDSASIAEYGRLVDPRGGGSTEIPVTADAEAEGRAQFMLWRYSEPVNRPGPITLDVRQGSAMRSKALPRDVLDRVAIFHQPFGIAPTVTFTGLVDQVEHVITSDAWHCTLTTSPVDAITDPGYFVLDVSELDVGIPAF